MIIHVFHALYEQDFRIPLSNHGKLWREGVRDSEWDNAWIWGLGVGGFGEGTCCLSDVGADGLQWSKVISGCHH